MNLETFVAEYNKRVDYNFEILKELGFATLYDFRKHEHIRKIVDDYMSFDKITKEDYDYESAEIYDYPEKEGEKTYELQMYSYESSRTVYFWVTTNETKEEYKRKKIEAIYKSVLECSKKAVKQFKELKEKLGELEKFAKMCTLTDIREKTPFFDKNGVRIYDGDVFVYLKYTNFEDGVPSDLIENYSKYENEVVLHPVFWYDKEKSWCSDVYGDCDYMASYDFNEVVVVTNKGEHPELYNY